MSEANKTQVAGSHYQSQIQHWDFVVANDLNYFEAQITKYVTRCRKKNGLQDLEKAQHFLAKYIELAVSDVIPMKRTDAGAAPGSGYINQD